MILTKEINSEVLLFVKKKMGKVKVNKHFIHGANCKSRFLKAAPVLSFGHPSPEGAEKDCGATTSLAHFGGKGLRDRGLKYKYSLSFYVKHDLHNQG
jgi:hypothetical protein